MSAPGIRHRRPAPPGEQALRPGAVVLLLLLAALAGILVSYALQESTTDVMRGRSASAVDTVNTPGRNESGLPVVTEMTLGTEVQRLMESGSTLQTPANFDVNRCLRTQGVTDPPMVMEQVEWGADRGEHWLIVHAPNDRDTLRANGGVVNVTIVRPTCGGSSEEPAEASRIWAGSALVGRI